jgi:hypothetical protein
MRRKDYKTITVFLNGGLGNQLFQWAMGYVKSIERNAELCLNISNLPENGFELAKFALPTYIVSVEDHKSYRIRNRFLKRIWMLQNFRHHYYEKKFEYQIETKKSNFRNFHGYFQSLEYFENYFEEITRMLRSKRNPSEKLNQYSDLFRQKKVLAVHVRRGDYLDLDDYHGVLPMAYYQEALGRFSVDQYQIVVFTNDVEFARSHFPPSYLFIGPTDLPCAAENLVLMSSASAIIGANSTLSLWAALIMDESQEVKVFPQPWFKTRSLDTSKLVPIGYSRVSVSF